jgi:F-type H+-transporting ATPase subunit b
MIDIGSTFIAESLAFILLIGFTYKYIWPVINATLEARREYVESRIKSAQDSQESVKQEFQKLQESKVVNEQLSRKLLQDTMLQLAELRKEFKAKSIVQAQKHEALLEKTKLDYQKKIRAEIKEEVMAQCKLIIEQTIKRALTESEHQTLREDIIKQL